MISKGLVNKARRAAKDLVVGQFTYGYIWLYLNQGTNLNPVFNGGSKIESNGSPITTSYS